MKHQGDSTFLGTMNQLHVPLTRSTKYQNVEQLKHVQPPVKAVTVFVLLQSS
jgi:hypothetical protein